MAMTPQEQHDEERHAALKAVEAALGASGQVEVCCEAVRRWPKFDGATAGDILDHTYDYDTFCAEAEAFFEANPGWSEADWGPALNYVLDALVLLDQPRDVPHVTNLLQRAGVMEPPDDPEHEGESHGDVTVALSWERPDGSRIYQSWTVCECAHLAENFRQRLGEPAHETVASEEAFRATAAAVAEIPGAVHTGEGF